MRAQLLYLVSAMTFFLSQGIADIVDMGHLHRTTGVEVALRRIKYENDLYQHLFKHSLKQLESLKEKAEEELEENVKKVEPLVKNAMENMSFESNRPMHTGKRENEIREIPLATKFPVGKKILFFDAKDDIMAYLAVKWVRSNRSKNNPPLGFCATWDKDSIDRFVENTDGAFVFQAMLNNDLLDTYNIEKLPAVMKVISNDEVEVQYGL